MQRILNYDWLAINKQPMNARASSAPWKRPLDTTANRMRSIALSKGIHSKIRNFTEKRRLFTQESLYNLFSTYLIDLL